MKQRQLGAGMRVLTLPSILLLVMLAGCTDNGQVELQQWMDETRRQVKTGVQKIEPPKNFMPFRYTGIDSLDPYSPAKLEAVFAAARGDGGLKPNLERRREPLEAWPLDAIKMVGSLERGGTNYAVVQADRSLFRVTKGGYLGQNFGMVTGITDTEIQLREIVQDSTGQWVEREARLELQESK